MVGMSSFFYATIDTMKNESIILLDSLINCFAYYPTM